MTPRETYRRIRAYDRANKRSFDVLIVVLNTRSAFYAGRLSELRRHERHAWTRLPKKCRRVVLAP